MVVKLTDELEKMQVLDNTYIIFSADNGFHLGQFGMLYDKRMLYEHDIRIPLLVRGPRVHKNITSAAPVMHHDLAPTILDMIGIKTPHQMDGTSWLPLVTDKHASQSWRTDFLVEYNGPKVASNILLRGGSVNPSEVVGLGGFSPAEDGATPLSSCSANKTDETLNCKCSCEYKNGDGAVYDRSPCDSKENTYKCLRTINTTEDSNYCEFDDGYVEYYDTKADPWGLVNLAIKNRSSQWKLNALSRRLYAHMRCKGSDCFNPSPTAALPTDEVVSLV